MLPNDIAKKKNPKVGTFALVLLDTGLDRVKKTQKLNSTLKYCHA